MNILKLSALRHSGSQRRSSLGGDETHAVQDELTTFNIVFIITEEEAQKVDSWRSLTLHRVYVCK